MAPATGPSSIPSTSVTSTTALPAEEVNSKATYSSKLGSVKGKSETSSTASGQRQPPAQKAWVSGPNPLVQRPSIPTHRNGTTTNNSSTVTASRFGLLREGLKVKITLDSGAEYEGTYLAGSDTIYTLKMVTQKKQIASGEMSNGTSKSNREQSTMSFQKKDIADVHVTGASLPNRESKARNGESSTFRTDTAISGNKSHGERTLQRWVPDENIGTEMSLGGNNGTDEAGWDQFEVNKRLFGVTTDYDENIYTTAIDKTHPEYSKRYAEADKKAREIERSAAHNSHVAEERVQDNITVDDSGLDEEDKYSGVRRKDFPPLTPSGRPEKYMPPGRRVNVSHAAPSGIHADPAIISSSLARKASPATDEEPKDIPQTSNTSNTGQKEITTPSGIQSTAIKTTTTPDLKAVPLNTSISASRTASPQSKLIGAPNATATVEHDVVSAFRGFAAQQRSQADRLRSSKAKADKESKLEELKKFAANFTLHSPVPTDLVSIIAKDPAKQREIQEKARRNAETSEQAKLTKANSAETRKDASPNPDQKSTQKSAIPPSHGTAPPVNLSNRSTASRTPNIPPQGPYNQQSFRADRPNHAQPIPGQLVRPVPNSMGQRLRSLEQSKNGQLPPLPPNHEIRQPPTGPAHSIDQSFSRRSSGTVSMMGAKLNPNSNEFRPTAATFTPNGNRSTGSSPRSNSVAPPNSSGPAPSGTLARRKPVQEQEQSNKESFDNIIENVASVKPPNGLEKKWAANNGGFKPAFDTVPTWRQPVDKEPDNSSMHLTYVKLFENMPEANQTMSPPQPSHVHPQAPHQHQLPFHLQNNISQRGSPRQHPMHLPNSQHNHGPSTVYNPDDHRMMPSQSAQSFASPRLQQVNMAYPSPMGQHAQLAYNQSGMQYPMGPAGPQMAPYRSYSGGHQFLPQQATHMGGPVMIPSPAGSGFMGPAGMVAPAPQMMYPGGQPHFVPQGNGPPPIAGANGYPSPGRSAPMMMSQGSQQGQSVYGMSPGVQYGQPMYAQHQPGQMPNMRYGSQGHQHFGTSPQMHQYAPPNRSGPTGGYNKNYQQPQHGPHPSAQQNQIPTGPQARAPDAGDEAK